MSPLTDAIANITKQLVVLRQSPDGDVLRAVELLESSLEHLRKAAQRTETREKMWYE